MTATQKGEHQYLLRRHRRMSGSAIPGLSFCTCQLFRRRTAESPIILWSRPISRQDTFGATRPPAAPPTISSQRFPVLRVGQCPAAHPRRPDTDDQHLPTSSSPPPLLLSTIRLLE